MNEAEQRDAVLTPAGMPTLAVGEIHYGLFFPVSAVKAYAERKGVTFQEMVGEGWKATEVGDEDLRFLLVEALNGAERRRQAFRPGPPRVIDDALIDDIFSLCHISQVWGALLQAWNQAPPETPSDPQRPAQLSPDGGPSSD